MSQEMNLDKYGKLLYYSNTMSSSINQQEKLLERCCSDSMKTYKAVCMILI